MFVEAYVMFFLNACLELDNCCYSNPVEDSKFFNQTAADRICKARCNFTSLRQSSICLVNCVHREMKYYTQHGTPSANAVDLLITLSDTYDPSEATDELCLRMSREHTVYKGKAFLDGMMKTLFCYWKSATLDKCPKSKQTNWKKCRRLLKFLNNHTTESYLYLEPLLPCLRRKDIEIL
ncbi:hypothetical protein Trydic_g21342 [Trypoxylus dichotomus]